jgi:hypothetical protein
MQAWMAESRARKKKQSSEVREAKWSALRWFALWKRPVQSAKPAPAVGHEKARSLLLKRNRSSGFTG